MSSTLSVKPYEPITFAAGETLSWTKDLADYSPSDGWALAYFFHGPDRFTATGTDASSYFDVTVPSTDTEKLQAGTYYWQAWVTKGDESYQVDSGQVTVTASLRTGESGAPYDGRSTAKRILDAIDALVEGKATLDQQEYQIGNRSLKRIPIADLIVLRKQYARIYSQERRNEKTRRGAPYFKTILTRFESPR
jgi:hypothetical protein